MKKTENTICLVGNPNSGKSSLFNILSGINQQVSNFPGVTVDKTVGYCTLPDGKEISLVDLPGLYSLHPNSSDEKVVIDILTDPKNEVYPDLILYVADTTNIERHLLLATQLIDLNIPMVFALNMSDLVDEKQRSKYSKEVHRLLGVPVINISSRKGDSIEDLKNILAIELDSKSKRKEGFYAIPTGLSGFISDVKNIVHTDNDYLAKILGHHSQWISHLSDAQKQEIDVLRKKHSFDDLGNQVAETMARYNVYLSSLSRIQHRKEGFTETKTDVIDNIITHRVIGPLLFLVIMLFVFQAIYAWSEAPMGWIESIFGWMGDSTRSFMPEAWYTDLLVDGVIAGLAGVMVFIPQIFILFLLISILEETGYMSRAVYMFDGIMRKFGLNGRSIVALVSSGACAIPAIMSTRTISNWKERLNTILVSPFISCSARIPVYAVLVGFVVPAGKIGIFNYRGLVFMGLYLLGIVGALSAAYVFKKILKDDGGSQSTLMIELPQYKPPIWRNAFLNVKEKVTAFIIEAGKIIFVISIALWFLASYGPTTAMEQAEKQAAAFSVSNNHSEAQAEDYLAGVKIEASYAGHLGKFIEPVIKPLGFDWKIGIALITSFAAREVFISTMATIYSVGSTEEEGKIRDRMALEVNPDTGQKVYTRATALSLLIFYVFAMQCMSTLAVVKRETNSWKWPIIQFSFMTAIAYFASFLVYQLFS